MKRGWVMVFLPLALHAGEEADRFSQLMRILDTPIKVATDYPMSLRETPAAVTLVTRAEIQAMGARDLLDVLRMVPGFDFGSDTQGVVGVGVRGNFAHYGKMLLLFDGQEMNEPNYGTTQFGLHYPISFVDRIEIIRGPGSAIYGGFAECAVVKVTTRSGGDFAGVSGGIRLAGQAGSFDRVGDVAYGQVWGDTEVSLSGSGGLGTRGQGPWPLPDGTVVSAQEAGRLGMAFLDLGVRSGGADFRFIHDDYTVWDFTGEFLPGTQPLTFRSDYFTALYSWRISSGLVLTPRFSVKEQIPWYYPQIGTLDTTRTVYGLDALWEPTSEWKGTLRAEATLDHAIQYNRPAGWTGPSHFDYQNQALAFQSLWTPGWFSMDAGLRMDRHDQFGTSLSPRVAITHAGTGWHLKAMASGAFCAPAIAELRDNPQLGPERTTTYEVEAGTRLGAGTYLTGNVFWIHIRDPIAYVLRNGADFFANFPYTGSQGFELQVQTRMEAGWVNSALSYAQARDQGAWFFEVPGHDQDHVGLAGIKFTTQVHWALSPAWAVSPGLTCLGPRYGYRLNDPEPTRFASTTLLDCRITWTPFPKARLGLGGHNLLGQPNPYIQAYGIPGAGGNPPLPGPGREADLTFSYNF